MKVKKTLLFILLMGISVIAPVIISASSNRSVQVTYNTGKNGLGYVSGRDTNTYHYLKKGQEVKLDINYSNATSKTVSSLYKRASTFGFFDKYSGEISDLNTGERFYTKYINESGSYYLSFRGGRSKSKVVISALLETK